MSVKRMGRNEAGVSERAVRLVNDINYGKIKASYEMVVATVAMLKETITNGEWSTAEKLMESIRADGRYVTEAAGRETCVGNMVRRILHIIREEYTLELKNKPVEADPQESLHKILTSGGDQTIDFGASMPDLRAALTEHVNEYQAELETCADNITRQASEHIHSNEIVMTLGKSKLVEDFLKEAAESRAFEVIVAEGGPVLDGQEMAVNLARAKIKVTLISDAAIFAMMSRVNKVIIGTETVMANGGLKATTGSRAVAQAAKHYSVPVLVLLPLYKLSPLHLRSYEQHGFNGHSAPSRGVLDGSNAPLQRIVRAYNPVFDYVPPELVTLFISNTGGNAPSYIYRLLSELYHPDDYELSGAD